MSLTTPFGPLFTPKWAGKKKMKRSPYDLLNYYRKQRIDEGKDKDLWQRKLEAWMKL